MMARKSKFFTTKTIRGSTMLFLHGKQIGSVWKDGKSFCLTLLKPGSSMCEEFPTFEQAEYFAWTQGI